MDAMKGHLREETPLFGREKTARHRFLSTREQGAVIGDCSAHCCLRKYNSDYTQYANAAEFVFHWGERECISS